MHGALIEDELENLFVIYCSEQKANPFGWPDDIAHMAPDQMAGLFIRRFPEIADECQGSDWSYAGWYQEMMRLTAPLNVPLAYETDDDNEDYKKGMPPLGPTIRASVIIPFPPPLVCPNLSGRPDESSKGLFD